MPPRMGAWQPGGLRYRAILKQMAWSLGFSGGSVTRRDCSSWVNLSLPRWPSSSRPRIFATASLPPRASVGTTASCSGQPMTKAYSVPFLVVKRTSLAVRSLRLRSLKAVFPATGGGALPAVREVPQVNARYDDEAAVVTRYQAVHLGLATQTEAGLMVPVLQHAERFDLWGCAAAVLRVSEAARSGTAARDELSGSNITITSLGALGGIVSTPVINHPEVAIVGINRIALRPMIHNGAVVARQMMNLSSSFDHRVVDGMHAAEFIQLLRVYLECPATLFVE